MPIERHETSEKIAGKTSIEQRKRLMRHHSVNMSVRYSCHVCKISSAAVKTKLVTKNCCIHACVLSAETEFCNDLLCTRRNS